MSDVGRPTVITPEVLRKLDEAFAMGCTDLEACLYADISKTALYEYQKDHPKFAERKETLKESPFLLARKTIYSELTDIETARWYMERKRKDEFSQRNELTGAEGAPIPILASVSTHNGNQQNSEPQSADQGSSRGDISFQDNLDTPITHQLRAVGQDTNTDERSIGINAPPEAGSDTGLPPDNGDTSVLQGQPVE